MLKKHFSISINAPVEKVWETMLDKDSYRKWVAAFNPAGSWYEGSREAGSKIKFLGPHPDDPEKIGGMSSEIAANELYKFISIKHLGEINDGQVVEHSDRAGALENYTFSEKDGVTTLEVDIDVTEDLADYMTDARPKALQILKEMSETK